MSHNISRKDTIAIKITAFGKSAELSQIIGFKGTIPMLDLVDEKPRQYKDIEENVEIPKTTLLRRINSLQMLNIIKKDPIIVNGRKTHLYSLTHMGSELMRFIHLYERTMIVPSPQQKIIEIEKTI